jgi:hypothetical protein
MMKKPQTTDTVVILRALALLSKAKVATSLNELADALEGGSKDTSEQLEKAADAISAAQPKIKPQPAA